MRRGPVRKLQVREQGLAAAPALLRPAYDGRHGETALSRFLERLASGTPIVAEGGMGALLASAVAGLRCPEEANLRSPESDVDEYHGYMRTGAELLSTNPLPQSRPKLQQHPLAQ